MISINMVVVYKGQEIKYSMPVADGRMNIKWLGLAAAQRFTATFNPRGYRRHLEKPGPKGLISTSARMLPRRVYTCNATFLHPEKSIEEELTDDEKVFVELTSMRALNALGRPLRERWMFIAFSVGDQNAQERSIAIEEEYKAMEEDREQKRVAEEAWEADQAAEKGVHMRRVLASQLYCQEKVKHAFERDWAELSHPIRQPIDKITEDLEEQALIKDVVLANYVIIVEVFKHYASVGAMRSTGELEFMEYSAFMYDLRDFSDAKSRDLVEKTYGESLSTCRSAKGPTISDAMGVAEFIFAVIRLACTQHRVKPTNSAGRAWSLGESGFGLSPKAQGVRSAHEALNLFMENEMVPLAHRKVVGVQIKTALSTDKILSIYYDNDDELKVVFDHYSKINDAITTTNAAAGAERLLNIFEFGKVVRDAKLMGGDNEEVDELTVKEVRQAFAGAQNELCGGTIDSSNSTTRSRSSPGAIIRPPWEARPAVEQMSYPEFLEGIARIAVLKWEEASISLKVKICRAIAAVSSLSETKHH